MKQVTEMQLRLLTLDDLARHRSELETILLEIGRASFHDVTVGRDYVERKFGFLEKYLPTATSFVIGAFDGEVLAGITWAFEKEYFDKKRIHWSEQGVLPEYRKMGITTRMVDYLFEEARKRGAYAIDFITTAGNTPLIGFAEKYGFSLERYQYCMLTERKK